MTLGWATHYNHSKVKVIGFCPGATNTSLLVDIPDKLTAAHYAEVDPDIMDLLTDTQE